MIRALLLGLVTVVANANAEEPATVDANLIKRWHDFYQAKAGSLPVVQVGEAREPLKFVEKPLLLYTNPVRGDSQHGSVHLWLDKSNRPGVIGSVWSAMDLADDSKRALCYEFHSLSAGELSIQVAPEVEWHPKNPGLEWKSLPYGQPPSKSRRARLIQLRRIAREMEAAGNSGESELRLLPQPVYRYDSEVDGCTDGAIFAFVMGTDPEMFVIVEAQGAVVESQSLWRIAPVRLSGTSLTLKYQGEVLFESPPWSDYAREKVYDFLYGVERLESMLTSE